MWQRSEKTLRSSAEWTREMQVLKHLKQPSTGKVETRCGTSMQQTRWPNDSNHKHADPRKKDAYWLTPFTSTLKHTKSQNKRAVSAWGMAQAVVKALEEEGKNADCGCLEMGLGQEGGAPGLWEKRTGVPSWLWQQLYAHAKTLQPTLRYVRLYGASIILQ